MSPQQMTEERLQTLSSLVISVLLIIFAAVLLLFVPGVTADNMAFLIVTAVVARWLQQGAQQAAERQAMKVQEAVQTAQTNGT